MPVAQILLEPPLLPAHPPSGPLGRHGGDASGDSAGARPRGVQACEPGGQCTFRRPGSALGGALDEDPPAPAPGAAGTSDCPSCLRCFGSAPRRPTGSVALSPCEPVHFGIPLACGHGWRNDMLGAAGSPKPKLVSTGTRSGRRWSPSSDVRRCLGQGLPSAPTGLPKPPSSGLAERPWPICVSACREAAGGMSSCWSPSCSV